MVEISKCHEPCFAKMDMGACKVLTCECAGKDNCVFYKPVECQDWIRKEVGQQVWLIPPEEYYDEKEMRLLRKRVRRF